MNQHPSTHGLTFCASGGHDAYPLPPLPFGFSWGWLEMRQPVEACWMVDLARRVSEEDSDD